jgi:hypothetical protein
MKMNCECGEQMKLMERFPNRDRYDCLICGSILFTDSTNQTVLHFISGNPKYLYGTSITAVIKENAVAFTHAQDVKPVPTIPPVPYVPPSVSVPEMLYASAIKALENSITKTSEGKQTMGIFSTLGTIIYNVIIGKSPITSWIGLIGFLFTSVGGYVSGVPDFSHLTLPALITYLVARFAGDTPKVNP